MKIRTTQHYAREWTAIDDDTYDYDAPMGWGNTEQEAVEDLFDKILDRLNKSLTGGGDDCECPLRQCRETGAWDHVPSRNCPIHGIDPDQAYDEMRDRELFG